MARRWLSFALKHAALKICQPSRYCESLSAGRSRHRIPMWRDIRTCPEWPWGPPSLLWGVYRAFPGGIAAGSWRCPPTPTYRRGYGVELYPFFPLWASLTCSIVNLPFTF